jgi:hypothetical protein
MAKPLHVLRRSTIIATGVVMVPVEDTSEDSSSRTLGE